MRSAKLSMVVGAVLVCAGATGYLQWRARAGTLPSFDESYAANWHPYGGDWLMQNMMYTDRSDGRGDKLLAGPLDLGEYSVSADMRFDMPPANFSFGDAGLLLRVVEPSLGVDAHRGFYAGLRSDDHALIVGSMNNTYRELATTPFPREIRSGRCYHLTFSAQGCTFRFQVVDPETKESAELSYVEHACTPLHGQIGLRSYYAKASWRNLQVSMLPQGR